MWRLQIISVLIITGIISSGNSHRILGVFPSPEKSHWAVGEGIVKALCSAGHEVLI